VIGDEGKVREENRGSTTKPPDEKHDHRFQPRKETAKGYRKGGGLAFTKGNGSPSPPRAERVFIRSRRN